MKTYMQIWLLAEILIDWEMLLISGKGECRATIFRNIKIKKDANFLHNVKHVNSSNFFKQKLITRNMCFYIRQMLLSGRND
jgi:hypothetical protein